MRVTVDKANCVGGGQCVVAAPEVFDQGDDGIVVLLDESPAEELRDAVVDAVQTCPALVIHMFDD